jgi:hypothetical protein
MSAPFDPHRWEQVQQNADRVLRGLDPLPSTTRPTPQATVDAIMYCVRERGIGALREPKNIFRLEECDAAARKQINSRIAKLVAAGRITLEHADAQP